MGRRQGNPDALAQRRCDSDNPQRPHRVAFRGGQRAGALKQEQDTPAVNRVRQEIPGFAQKPSCLSELTTLDGDVADHDQVVCRVDDTVRFLMERKRLANQRIGVAVPLLEERDLAEP